MDLDSLCNSPGTRDSGINEDCMLLGMGPWEGLLDVVKVREGGGGEGGKGRQVGRDEVQDTWNRVTILLEELKLGEI